MLTHVDKWISQQVFIGNRFLTWLILFSPVDDELVKKRHLVLGYGDLSFPFAIAWYLYFLLFHLRRCVADLKCHGIAFLCFLRVFCSSPLCSLLVIYELLVQIRRWMTGPWNIKVPFCSQYVTVTGPNFVVRMYGPSFHSVFGCPHPIQNDIAMLLGIFLYT